MRLQLFQLIPLSYQSIQHSLAQLVIEATYNSLNNPLVGLYSSSINCGSMISKDAVMPNHNLDLRDGISNIGTPKLVFRAADDIEPDDTLKVEVKVEELSGIGSSKDENDCELKLTQPISIENKIKRVQKISHSRKIVKKNKAQGKHKILERKSKRLKNLVKNYGKNCAMFAISEVAHEYLLEILRKEKILEFKEWVKCQIPKITNIANFRDMLLVAEKDNHEVALYKKAFKNISEIFVRDFSHNWIMNSSRLNDAKGYLFARFKMLRRIRDPQRFTYVH